MLAVVATLKVKPGAGAQFEALAKELVSAVRANERGCTLYALHRAEAADTYVFVERYLDEAAVAAHRQSEHFRTIGRKMGEFMAGAPEVLRLSEVD